MELQYSRSTVYVRNYVFKFKNNIMFNYNLILKLFNEDFVWGERHKQTLLLFLCMVIAYALRVNMSVGIVAMTDKSSANNNFIVSEYLKKIIYKT